MTAAARDKQSGGDEAPARTAPPAADGKKISIRNLLAGNRQPENAVSEPPPDLTVKDSNDFTTEELKKAWMEFAKEVREESPRISITLSALSPELLPDKTIILKLDNSILKETFDHNFRTRLENHLRTSLHNGSVRLLTSVEATERGEILYSPEQKFNHLASKNPSLKDLKKTFNLDFE